MLPRDSDACRERYALGFLESNELSRTSEADDRRQGLKDRAGDTERLTKKVALAVFSSDALSSTAYATEEILLVLAVAVAAGQAVVVQYVIPVSIGIAAAADG